LESELKQEHYEAVVVHASKTSVNK